MLTVKSKKDLDRLKGRLSSKKAKAPTASTRVDARPAPTPQLDTSGLENVLAGMMEVQRHDTAMLTKAIKAVAERPIVVEQPKPSAWRFKLFRNSLGNLFEITADPK